MLPTWTGRIQTASSWPGKSHMMGSIVLHHGLCSCVSPAGRLLHQRCTTRVATSSFLPLLHDNKKQMRVVTLGLAAAGGKCGVCAAGCEKSNAVIPPGGTICYRVLFAGLFLFLDYWGM